MQSICSHGVNTVFVKEIAPGIPVFKKTEIVVVGVVALLLAKVATSIFPSPSKSAVVKSYNPLSGKKIGLEPKVDITIERDLFLRRSAVVKWIFGVPHKA